MAFYCINYTTGVNVPEGGTPAAPWQTIEYAETQINGGAGPQVGDEFRIQDQTVKTLLGTGRQTVINTLGNLSFTPTGLLTQNDHIMIGDSEFTCWVSSVTATTIVATTSSSNPMWTGADIAADLPIYKITGSVDVVYNSGSSPALDRINAANATFTPGANDIIISGGWDGTFTAKTAFGRTHFRRTGTSSATSVAQISNIFDVGKMYGYQFKDFVFNRLNFADYISTAVPIAVFNVDNIVMTGNRSVIGYLNTSALTDVYTTTWNNCYFNVASSSSLGNMSTVGQSIVINNPTLVCDSGWNSVSGGFFTDLNGSNAPGNAKYLRVSVTGDITFINDFQGAANPQFPIQGSTMRAMQMANSYTFTKTGTVYFSKQSAGYTGWLSDVYYELDVTPQLMSLLYTPFDFYSQLGSLTLNVPGFTNSLTYVPGIVFSNPSRSINYGPKGGMVTWNDTVNNKTYQIENYAAWRLNTTEHETGTNCIEWKTGYALRTVTERLPLNGINVNNGDTIQVTVRMKSPTGTTTPDLKLIMATTLNSVLTYANNVETLGNFTKTSGDVTTTYTDIVYTFTTPVTAQLGGYRTAVAALSMAPGGSYHDYFIDKVTTVVTPA